MHPHLMDWPVLLLTSTGFVVRTVVLQGLVARLSAHIPVVAAVPDPHDVELLRLIKNTPMGLISHPRVFSKIGRWDAMHVSLWQQSYMSNISRQVLGWMLPSYNRTLKYRMAVAVLGFLFGSYGKATRWLEQHYIKQLRRTDMYTYWYDILRQMKPSMVVSGMLSWAGPNEHSEDLPCLVAAHDLGILCTTIVQSWDNPYVKAGIFPLFLQRIWTWSDTMTSLMQARQPSMPKDVYRSVGALQMEFHYDTQMHGTRDEALHALKLPANAQYIVYGGTTAMGFPQEPQLFKHVMHTLQRLYPEMWCVLRLHPKDTETRWRDVLNAMHGWNIVLQIPGPEKHLDEGGIQDPHEFYRNQLQTLAHAACVVSSFTTLLVDAAVIDKPAMCMVWAEELGDAHLNRSLDAIAHFPHIIPLLRTQGVRGCTSLEDFSQALQAYINNPALDRNKRHALACLMHKPGSSPSEEIADDILEMLKIKKKKSMRISA